MSNVIVANLKSGKRIAIGINSGGHYPLFYIRKEWGNEASSQSMISYLKEKAKNIFLGTYGTGPVPYCYTFLTPKEFEIELFFGWPIMRSHGGELIVNRQDPSEILYKHIRKRWYGKSSARHQYVFVDGVYTEQLTAYTQVHWTWMKPCDTECE